MEPDGDELRRIYYYMRLTRALEERLLAMRDAGRLAGGLRSGRGQEATAVASAAALAPGDIIAPLHRDLGAMLVRGLAPGEVLAQWTARSASLSGGRDSHLHIGDMRDRMILPAPGVVGMSLPVAAGVALAARRRGERRVVLAYIGDAATNTGAFHETLNFAATLDLPFVCLIENNSLAHATPAPPRLRLKHLADRAAAYGIPGFVVDGTDPREVLAVTARAVDLARDGRGPSIIEAKTALLPEPAAIAPEDAAAWRQRDPLARFALLLRDLGWLTDAREREYDELIADVLDEAERAADALPAPDPTAAAGPIFAPDDAPPLGPISRVAGPATLVRAVVR